MLTSCSKETSVKSTPLIEVSGFSDFGEIITGDLIGSIISIHNNTEKREPFIFETQTSEFNLVSQDQSCQTGISANTSCQYKILIRATSAGQKIAKLSFMGELVEFKAKAIIAGVLSLDKSEVDFSTIVAGDQYKFSLYITNSGSIKSTIPVFSGPDGFSVDGTGCGEFIEPQQTCEIQASYKGTKKNHDFSESVTGDYGAKSVTFTLKGSIRAGEMSGNIKFVSMPIVKSDGNDYSIMSVVMSDSFGNVIEDGTTVTVSFYNLKNSNGTYDSVLIGSQNGIFIVPFKSILDSPGDSTISLNGSLSSGTARFNVINQ